MNAGKKTLIIQIWTALNKKKLRHFALVFLIEWFSTANKTIEEGCSEGIERIFQLLSTAFEYGSIDDTGDETYVVNGGWLLKVFKSRLKH